MINASSSARRVEWAFSSGDTGVHGLRVASHLSRNWTCYVLPSRHEVDPTSTSQLSGQPWGNTRQGLARPDKLLYLLAWSGR